MGFVFLLASPAFARHVLFVDNSKAADGIGTPESPFNSLATAMPQRRPGDIIYVAETSVPYTQSISLREGQMLIGSAYGLEALRQDSHIELDAPVVAAVRGPGPTIANTVLAAGDNVIAGCTIATDRVPGLVSSSPRGALRIRQVWFRPSNGAFALSVDSASDALSISGGGVVASTGGSGLAISGGYGEVTVDHFPISGQSGGFAVSIVNKTAGAVTFDSSSPIRFESVDRDAIVFSNCKGKVQFRQTLAITSRRARGLLVANSSSVEIASAGSRIESVNGAAVDVRDSNVDITLQSVSADVAPQDGIALDKLRGHFRIVGEDVAGSGGTIRNARSYGIRIEQSSGADIAHVNVVDTEGAGKVKCPEDLASQSTVVCRAALFLRHLSSSAFRDVVIDGSQPTGINVNNSSGLTFTDLAVRNSGDDRHASILLQEVIGSIDFHGCKIAGGVGGSVTVEQRFNRGRLLFDRCSFDERLGGHLVGSGQLELNVNDLRAARLTGSLIDLHGTQDSGVSLSVRGAYVGTAGPNDPVIDLDLNDRAAACVDIADSFFGIEPTRKPVHVTVHAPTARLRVAHPADASIEAPGGKVTEPVSCFHIQ